MSTLQICVHVPSILCDWCQKRLYPAGFNFKDSQTIGLHRVPFDNPNTEPEFGLTGFTQQDLERQAMEAGWKQINLYNRTFTICPECQKKGSDPAFEHRLKRLALLLGMKSILAAQTLEQAKETAVIAIREGEDGL